MALSAEQSIKPKSIFQTFTQRVFNALIGAAVMIVLMLVVFMFTGCQSPSTSKSQLTNTHSNIFRMNLGTEPPDLDPAKMRDLTSFTVIQTLMKGLTQFGQDLTIQPAIAERWTKSADGLSYTFYLRKDAKWSDGKPVTANDFAYAWERALDPNMAAEYAFFLFELKNGKAFYNKELQDFNQVGVNVVNPHTLKVQLERPMPFFLDLMATPIASPLRKDVIDKYGDSFVEAGNFVSNGAYTMTEWVHEDKLVVKPNPYFYGKKPDVNEIIMLMVNDANTSVVMYENGELDFIETTTSIPSFDVRRLRELPESTTMGIHRLNYFGFSVNKPPFDNVKVRQAFAMALDRSYYPRLMKSGQFPTSSLITEGLLGYNEERGLHFNPDKAKQLLAEAGYPDGKNFPEVTLGYTTGYDQQKECEIAQFLWKEHLGVNVRLENMEWKVFLSRLRENPPQIFRLGWFVDYPDADSYMGMFISDSGNNHTHWKSKRYDSLVADAVVEQNPDKRFELYNEAQKLLLEDAAAIAPVYQAEKTFLVKPHVNGLKINGINLINLDELSISE